MRIVILLLLVGVIQTFADESYGQSTLLNLNFEDEAIISILNKIEDLSEFNFMFDATKVDLEQRKSINCEDKTIDQILDEILKDSDINYQISDRQIVLSPRKTSNVSKEHSISGKVTDVDGQPLPGVTIVIVGTSHGTITDNEGGYVFDAVPDIAVLKFSFVGLRTQEIPVKGKTTLDVVMLESSIGLDEVIAVGYGSVRKRDLTGAVSTVSGIALKDVPVSSASEAIVGRMAGVHVTKSEGSPDAQIKIRVRGGGSVTQDNSPLYVVDGFPVENIDDIAPSDIESISVLKDASSTAIYGAKGANGVILVTTKTGFEGKTKVSYNTYYGIKNITKKLDVLNPYEYVLYQYETVGTLNNFENYFGVFDDYKLYKQVSGTDWQEEVFGRTGTSEYHNINIRGGGKQTQVSVNLAYNDEDEIMLGSGYEKTNATINVNHKVNSWMSVSINARMSDTDIDGAGTSNNSRLLHSVLYRPINGLSDFVDADLMEAQEPNSTYTINPVDQTLDDYRLRERKTYYFGGGAYINFTKNLRYRFQYGVNSYMERQKRFYGRNTSNTRLFGGKPMASINDYRYESKRISNVLTYRKNNFLPDHDIELMVGEELSFSKSESITSSSQYFPEYITAESALSMMPLGIPEATETMNDAENILSSFFGRLKYDYNDKYLVTMSLRADGSSRFAEGNRWGYFPSAAFAWRINSEEFMAGTKDWISDLKLRVSYGAAGNNRISSDTWQRLYYISSRRMVMGGDGEGATTTPFLAPSWTLSNPELTWETTYTRNLGLDFSLFDQRVSGAVELYSNNTEDLLIRASLPTNSGYSYQWQNIGETTNKGFEFSINNHIIRKKDYSLDFSFNIGFNKNKIVQLGEEKEWYENSYWGNTGSDFLVKEGEPVGLMYGYVTDGMYSIDDFVYEDGTYTLKEGIANNNTLLALIGDVQPGTLKLKDLNNDEVIDDNDKTVIGNANPKHTGGFNLSGRIKGFDIGAFFNWSYGNDIYNANKLYFTTLNGYYPFRNVLDIMNTENRWTNVDLTTGERVTDPTALAAMNEGKTMWAAGNVSTPLHSWGIEDGSFLRLNNLTIGYSLPKRLLSRWNLSKLRIYGTAYNLMTWTKYSGYDPEVDTRRSTPLTPGVDWSAYPRSKSFIVGLNVEF